MDTCEINSSAHLYDTWHQSTKWAIFLDPQSNELDLVLLGYSPIDAIVEFLETFCIHHCRNNTRPIPDRQQTKRVMLPEVQSSFFCWEKRNELQLIIHFIAVKFGTMNIKLNLPNPPLFDRQSRSDWAYSGIRANNSVYGNFFLSHNIWPNLQLPWLESYHAGSFE